MAQNITLLGASYSNVPAVDLPKTGGGTASFTDVTDTTAAAADVAQGKYFYLANGTRTEGTASGGGSEDGSVWQDAQGFVNLDDQPGTHVEVDTLNVTTNGTYTAPTGHAYSPVTVNVSGGGGDEPDEKAINFYDYDGTRLYSYSTAEWASVSTLPSNPTHTGLTAQGWNWTKSQIDTQLTAMPDGDVNVGQMYATDDGKTRIYIHLDEERKSPMIGLGVQGTVDIDWGDGSAHDTLTGSSYSTMVWTSNHNYAHGGDYVIKLNVTSGVAAIYGSNSSNQYCRLLHYNSGSDGRNYYYLNAIKHVEIGSGIRLHNYAFYYCHGLKSITIPNTVQAIESNAFYSCDSLKSLTIPNNILTVAENLCYGCYSLTSISMPGGTTTINNAAVRNCYALTSLTVPSTVTSTGTYLCGALYNVLKLFLPSGITSLGNYSVYSTNSMTKLTIPSSVTSIGTYAFSSNYGMKEYHFKPTTPPTLSNTNAFNNIPADCIIYVPSASLSTYQSANNWSSFASYMQGE